MAKVVFNSQTPFGYLVGQAVNQIQQAAATIARVQQVSAMIQAGASGNNTLDDASAVGTALFGAPSGESADAAFALGNLATNLAAFMSANQAYLTTLDNGDVA